MARIRRGRPHGLVDQRRLIERIVVRGCASEQLIVHPDVRDALHDISTQRDLRRPEKVAEAGDGELLRSGAGGDVDVRRHRLLEAVTCGNGNKRSKGEDE